MHETILLELQYLPSIQYMAKLLHYPTVILEQQEHFVKGSYRNRCHIASANGLLRLSIPLQKGKHQQQSIREVRLSYDEPWHRQHWASIRSAYGNAPFFEHYVDELAPLFERQYDFLFDWNWDLLQLLLELLQLEPSIQLSKSYQKTANSTVLDFRNVISPKLKRQKDDPHFELKPYAQVFGEKYGFLPNLSVLDLLFCTGPQANLLLEEAIYA